MHPGDESGVLVEVRAGGETSGKESPVTHSITHYPLSRFSRQLLFRNGCVLRHNLPELLSFDRLLL